MADDKLNIPVNCLKDVSNIINFEGQPKSPEISSFIEDPLIQTEEVQSKENVIEDSGTEVDSRRAGGSASEGSEDSVTGSDDDSKSSQNTEGKLFAFASKEWLQDYAKRLPEILSKIAEPHFYKNNKCRFVNIDSPYKSFEPETVGVKIKTENGKFQVKVDASLFILKNINVQVFNDKINVAAYHQMDGPFGHEAHEMQQIFPLPDNVDKKTITAELTPKGTLIIEARLNKDLKKTQFVPKKNQKIPI